MHFLKKEWRTILPIVWLVVITIVLVRISGQLSDMHDRNALIASTLGSVESIVITTDSGVAQVSRKVGEIESDVDFIVERIRRR